MSKIKAFIFDFDGTIVDSEKFHFNSLNEVLKKFNVQYDYDFYLKTLAGIPNAQSSKMIIEYSNLSISIDKFAQMRKEVATHRLKNEDIIFMPYAIEMLDFLHAKEYPIALVTGSPRILVDYIFSKTNLSKYFKTTITCSDVKESKPHPESYDLCVNTLGFKKNEYLVFEDTQNGIKSAKAAGLTTFAIQHYEAVHPKLKIADKIFKDFSEVQNYVVDKKLI
ncbi:HAD family hydrolase [Urechidicola croceus]|uniref:ABC transporter ATP-binding protein n=1 Tax=Urechidicola croceus TaxID=1850246 RepID=A0A1D8PAE0_9FLAO|nr:HAD family phosphatase [Urechidicola croceus]AOW21540.1 hypothetical protein LPB138_13015 [Urechidicola croceus]